MSEVAECPGLGFALGVHLAPRTYIEYFYHYILMDVTISDHSIIVFCLGVGVNLAS